MQPSSFNALTEAEEVVKGLDLRGKLIVIAGASAGTGAEAARVLAQAGADLFLGARRADRLEALARSLAERYAVSVGFAELDLAAEASVDAFADAALSLARPIDVLICNAGITSETKRLDARGNELVLSVNFLSHALLISRLSERLKQAGSARLVCLTSRGHQQGPLDFDDPNFERSEYDSVLAYRRSKSGNALTALKAQKELGPAGVSCFAVHPGVIKTEIQQSLSTQTQLKSGKNPADNNKIMKSIAAGAATTVWAAVWPGLEQYGGAYLEDCSIGVPVDTPNPTHGVMPHVRDPELADQAWIFAEKLLGRSLPL